ncbi:MAG: tRNA (N(6)-L-threonylcarbamoyladenosine(37)-C(2))-methylthiotransferase MtaB [Sedimentisphaerales bacterium]|nr:tRNA (N(6)-L-threonylcarbamoyladenosine(37)-C(2))-methylthiotransferase MtaB [Sedimentisphaerales bacterium]
MLKTFAIETLGCKVNQYESRQIHTLLQQLGLKAATNGRPPDLALVNTCCITHTASSKSRQYARKMLKRNKNGVVVLIGCLSRAPDTELANLGENVIIINNRSQIAAELSKIALNHDSENTGESVPINRDSEKNGHINNIRPEIGQKIKIKNRSKLCNLPLLTSFQGQTRAFVKAQDGCDMYCTYCIIPFVRPEIMSRPVPEILAEAAQLTNSGHKEIVLTGINLGSYGRITTRKDKWQNPKIDYLADLLDVLADIENLPRIRVSSLNPQDITTRLLDVFCEHKNIMPHLHLSLQSGSDNILRKMARQYTAGEYLEKVEMIKSRLETPAITTDIIVGFPGETDRDYQATLELAEKVGFARVHVFSFSARKGTAAFNMKPKTKPDIIKARASRLKELADKLAYDYRQQFIGRTAQVLIETVEDGIATGRAERYFEVKINPDLSGQNRLHKNDLVKVTLTENEKSHLTAEIF